MSVPAAASSSAPSPAPARTPAPGPRRRVLFLYNVPDWAVHNVGRDWAALLADTHDFTLLQYGRHENEDPEAYDHVLWGYSTLRHSGRMLARSLAQRPLGWLRWERSRSPRLLAVVQDPSELFPEVPDWRHAPARTAHLRRFHRLAVTSNEMLEVMRGLGLPATKINTRSLLPLRDAAGIAEEPLRVVTRAQRYPRKNLALFDAVAARFRGAGAERFDAVLGMGVVGQDAYTDLLDGYNCYVCTSWQEGGPLPLMDALRRGCVALTTRVGQTDELVEDGGNGFFCTTEEEFAARLAQLAADPALLLRMRRRALELAGRPVEEAIRAQLRSFLP